MTNPIAAVFPAPILQDLEAVQKRLQEQHESRDPRLSEWTAEPLRSGGKRVRPLLALCSFHACGGADLQGEEGETARRQMVDAATALELIHTASLVHDDIMDQAAERRGAPSTFAAHGTDGAIIVGDYLFTQAFALGATLPKRIIEMTSDACRRLCEGQLREQALQDSGAADRDAYYAVIRDKTSALLSAGCGMGAQLAGAPENQVQALYRYGEAIGSAFQILDDVLDVAGDPKWTGKPVGTDYLAGTFSSPFLNYLDRGGTLHPQRRRQDFPAVRRELFETGAVAESQMEASGQTMAALLELQVLAPSPARDALARLAELLMERAQ